MDSMFLSRVVLLKPALVNSAQDGFKLETETRTDLEKSLTEVIAFERPIRSPI